MCSTAHLNPSEVLWIISGKLGNLHGAGDGANVLEGCHQRRHDEGQDCQRVEADRESLTQRKVMAGAAS